MSGMSFIRGWQPHRPLANTTHPDTVRIFARFGVQITALTPARVTVHDSHDHLALEVLQVQSVTRVISPNGHVDEWQKPVRTPHFDHRVPSLPTEIEFALVQGTQVDDEKAYAIRWHISLVCVDWVRCS